METTSLETEELLQRFQQSIAANRAMVQATMRLVANSRRDLQDIRANNPRIQQRRIR